ncbi:MAG: RNA pyrophosphohydrolase [Pseudomonadota bacterium]
MPNIDVSALPYRPCVGVMLVNADGHAFAGQRIDNYQDAWQMPQGGIDPGEKPEKAAFRELWEETGVTRDKVTMEAQTTDWLTYDLPEDLIGKIWGGKYRGQKQLWFLFRFHGQDSDISIATEHPEFREWAWMDVALLPLKIVPFKRDLYQTVVAAFEPKITWA